MDNRIWIWTVDFISTLSLVVNGNSALQQLLVVTSTVVAAMGSVIFSYQNEVSS